MFIKIPIDKILPHPKNPRGDLGDLTELAAGIKQVGVLQPLTVVPEDAEVYQRRVGAKHAYNGSYIAVIGHRRHAAAKLAELDEVPCIVSLLDEKAQITTMLMENMQRSDLTPYEQAQGFQMMLDLGETVGSVAEKTGFSKSTVYSRVKMLELDADKFKAAAARGGTIADYTALEKIKDVKLRNETLEKIGTNNFNNALFSATQQEKREENKIKILDVVKTFAEHKKSSAGLDYVGYYGFGNGIIPKKPDDADTVKYFYTVDAYSITLYKEKTAGKTASVRDTGPSPEEVARRNRVEQLAEAAERAYKLRSGFMAAVTSATAKKHIAEITASIAYNTVEGYGMGEDDAAKILGLELDEDTDFNPKFLQAAVSDAPELALLKITYALHRDSISNHYHNYNGKYQENGDIDILYDLLAALGYGISDEEKALRDGTHELYYRKEDGGDE